MASFIDKKRTREEVVNTQTSKHVGFPALTARENWGHYFAGMATEAVYALLLFAAGILMAVIAFAIYR